MRKREDVTASRKSLTESPLVEALVEMKWHLDPTPTGGMVDKAYPFYVGGLNQLLKGEFPFQEKLPAADFPDEMTPHVVKYRFRAGPDRWPVVQIGSGIASYNSVKEYDWEAFRAGALSCYKALNDAYGAASADGSKPNFEQFSLRYINAVPLPDGADPFEFMKEMLGVGIELPDGVLQAAAGKANVLSISVGLPLSYIGTVGALNIGLGEREGVRCIIWDTTISGANSRAEGATDDFGAWLKEAHEVAETWFFTLIAGKLEGQFRAGAS